MRCAPRSPDALLALAAALLALPLPASGQGTDPSEAAVPWTGAPAPVDGRTVGGALSPYGSHLGAKAILDPDADVPATSLAATALLDGRTGRQGRRPYEITV